MATGIQTLLCALLIGLSALPLAGARGLVVTSGSMEPTIGVGALAIIVPVETDEVRTGDILTYHGYGEGRLTTHRVVDVVQLDSGLHFQTRGDANDAVDPNLAPARGVVGGVALTLPHVGRLLTLMMQRSVLLGLVALTAVPPLLTELRRLGIFATRRRFRGQARARWSVAISLTVAVATGAMVTTNAVLTDRGDARGNTFTTSDTFVAD